MRILLALAVLAGCATTTTEAPPPAATVDALTAARGHVQACEDHRSAAERAGDYAGALRIGSACNDWRYEVARLERQDEDRRERRVEKRRAVGRALSGFRDAYSGSVNCTSTAVGNTVHTTCN